jgi:hypothetical protein
MERNQMKNSPIARRTLLRQAGPGIGAGFAATISAGVIYGAPPAAAQAAAARLRKAMFGATNIGRKRATLSSPFTAGALASPGHAAKPSTVLFLVHGSSLSALSSYDWMFPAVDPAKVKSPVLMTRGEWDGNSTNDDLLDFFRQLPNGDRQFVISFSKNRQLLCTR